MKQAIYVFVKDEHAGDEIRKVPVEAAGLEILLYRPKYGLIIGQSEEKAVDDVVKRLEDMDSVHVIYTEKQLKRVLVETKTQAAAEPESVSSSD